MEASFPTVDVGTPLDALYSLFSFIPAVEGIITKIDIISARTKWQSNPYQSGV